MHRRIGFGRMIEDYKKECKNSIIKDGIALKGDYSFDELKTWLDSNLQLSIQLKSNSLGNSKSKGLLFFSIWK